MNPPRFFVDSVLENGAEVSLPANAGNHAVRVLRLAIGSTITLFNGRGGEFSAHLTHADKRGARCRIVAHDPVERESPIPITLLQGVSRAERMDYTLQKGVELGVSAFVPVAAARSTVRLDAERAASRHAHWRGVIAGACEQCGRNRPPQLHPLVKLDAALTSAAAGPKLLLDAAGTVTLGALARPDQGLTLLAGPEGGFDALELASAAQAGFTPVRLGPRVLRTETAAVAALAAIQVLWGDLG